jgi:hypothetical protein
MASKLRVITVGLEEFEQSRADAREAKAYAALETVIEAANMKGRCAFDVLAELMGKPI